MLTDQTCAAAKAVRAYIECRGGIEASWDGNQYTARPYVAEWHNGRENGYVFYMWGKGIKRQINIAVFEHRNSDNICCVAWISDGIMLNPPTLADIPEGTYKDKYDVTKSLPYTGAHEMADYVCARFEEFWGG